MQPDSVLVRPLVEALASEFWPIVADEIRRQLGEVVEKSSDAIAPSEKDGQDTGRVAPAIIDERKDAKTSPVAGVSFVTSIHHHSFGRAGAPAGMRATLKRFRRRRRTCSPASRWSALGAFCRITEEKPDIGADISSDRTALLGEETDTEADTVRHDTGLDG